MAVFLTYSLRVLVFGDTVEPTAVISNMSLNSLHVNLREEKKKKKNYPSSQKGIRKQQMC